MPSAPLVVPLSWAVLVPVVVVVVVVATVAVVVVVVIGRSAVSFEHVAGVAVGPETLLDRSTTGFLATASMPRGRWVLAVHGLRCSRIVCRSLAQRGAFHLLRSCLFEEGFELLSYPSLLRVAGSRQLRKSMATIAKFFDAPLKRSGSPPSMAASSFMRRFTSRVQA